MKRLLHSMLVFLPLWSAAQGNEEKLRAEFLDYQLPRYQEKVYLHVDRSFYLSGETIWFSVYNVDGYLHRLSDLSRVVYVELLNRDQKPVYQVALPVKGGRGSGSLLLGNGIPSGQYQLRAYTNWMKNFPPEFYFNRTITVVNALLPRKADSTGLSGKRAVYFFPESGRLLAGVETKITFKTTDAQGRGLAAKGWVLGEKNDTVCSFATAWNGMGRFALKPAAGARYRAVLRFSDTSITSPLPEVESNGVAATLEDRGEKFLLKVYARGAAAGGNILLLAHTRQVPVLVQAQAAAAENVFSIDKSLLGDGISQLLVMNEQREPVAQRLVWKDPRNSRQVRLATNQPVYGKRQKVEVDLQQAPENMSVAVYRLDGLQPETEEDILQYLLGHSELRGPLEFPSEEVRRDVAAFGEYIDMVLCSNGWGKFDPVAYKNKEQPVFAFLPEKEGMLVSAQVFDRQGGNAAAGVETFLSVPGTGFKLSQAISDAEGRLLFNMDPYYGHHELVAHAPEKNGRHYRVDIQPAFSDRFRPVSVSHGGDDARLSATAQSLVAARSVNSQLENAYLAEQKKQVAGGGPDTLAFYGMPDKKYVLDDYTRFPTMEEVMHEFIPEIRVRKSGPAYSFRVKNALLEDFFQNEPLVLVDGVPVKDVSKIMQLDPLRFREIDILTHKLFDGTLVREGVINYRTYAGDLAGYTLDADESVLQYPGLEMQRLFYMPAYAVQADKLARIPDRRELLYWNPLLQPGDKAGSAHFSFYSSDQPGRYQIVMQGLDAAGRPCVARAVFEVK